MQRGESMDKARKEMLAEASSNYTESIFESIKHVNEYGVEFWYARELQTALEYKQWRRFENIINKAKDACLFLKYQLPRFCQRRQNGRYRIRGNENAGGL